MNFKSFIVDIWIVILIIISITSEDLLHLSVNSVYTTFEENMSHYFGCLPCLGGAGRMGGGGGGGVGVGGRRGGGGVRGVGGGRGVAEQDVELNENQLVDLVEKTIGTAGAGATLLQRTVQRLNHFCGLFMGMFTKSNRVGVLQSTDSVTSVQNTHESKESDVDALFTVVPVDHKECEERAARKSPVLDDLIIEDIEDVDECIDLPKDHQQKTTPSPAAAAPSPAPSPAGDQNVTMMQSVISQWQSENVKEIRKIQHMRHCPVPRLMEKEAATKLSKAMDMLFLEDIEEKDELKEAGTLVADMVNAADQQKKTEDEGQVNKLIDAVVDETDGEESATEDEDEDEVTDDGAEDVERHQEKMLSKYRGIYGRISPHDLEPVMVGGCHAIVGQGNHAIVRLCKFFGQLVAVKTFYPSEDILTEEQLEQHMSWETEACYAVSHLKGFPDYYGTVIRSQVTSYVMQFLGDPDLIKPWTLSDMRNNRGPLISNDELLKVFQDIVEALRGQQNAGYLHCSIKLENCIVYEEADGSFSGKLIHLGMAVEIGSRPSSPIILTSKPHNREYDREIQRINPGVAPEILRNQTGDTPATEIFALGYMFRELGMVFDIKKLAKLGKICQHKKPTHRPNPDMIKMELQCIRKEGLEERLRGAPEEKRYYHREAR